MLKTTRHPLLASAAALLIVSWVQLQAADASPQTPSSDSVVCQLSAPDNGEAVRCTIYAPSPVPEGKAGLVVHLYGSGGSHERYNVGRRPYDEFRRLLAARGYWLVVPDLGPKHWMNEAACRQVDAVIAALVQQKHVDPARVHLFGTSMGGGSSLIYVMRRPGKVKSVVAIFPMTDFVQWLQERPGYRQLVETAHGITVERRQESLEEISPLRHPEAFRKTPVFLLHGDQDTVVQPRHSRDLAAALKEKGCAVVYREAAGAVHSDDIALPYQQELADFITDGSAKSSSNKPGEPP